MIDMRRLTPPALTGILTLVALLSRNDVNAFYLPGVAPQSFSVGDPVKLKVNKMTSQTTLFPVDYYRLPFCQPPEGIKPQNENLGEFLSGDRIDNSPYVLRMKEEMYCEQVCVTNLGRTEQKDTAPSKVVRAIRKNYHNNWIVDNLNCASKLEDDTTITTRYWQGFPIGYVEDNIAYINNHANILIHYHPVETSPGDFRVVRFTVEPFSIKHLYTVLDDDDDDDDDDDKDGNEPSDKAKKHKKVEILKPITSCDPKSPTKEHTSYEMTIGKGRAAQPASGKVLFTYDVMWEESPIHWASRWDVYLSMDESIPARVHWLSILNSIVVVVVLSAMIAAILVRNLRRDFSRYNKLATDEEKEEELEEYGWKLVHADVFRPPSFSPMLLAVSAGTGSQIFFMSFFTILLSCLGFLSPAKRGALIMAQLLLFVLLGSVSGYVTARLYKTFKGKSWQKATTMAATLYPGLTFFVFLLLDIVAWTQESTDHVPFSTLIILIVLWFGISAPLVFFGAYFGYKHDAIEFPVNTSSIPRQIPDQPWFMGFGISMLLGGILPFGAAFVELYFILASVWMDQYYYVFGFLMIVFVLLVVTSAEITVLFNYFHLCNENYHWWWKSFCMAGSAGGYVFLYSISYFKQLQANSFATYLLYYGYMSIISIGLFTMLGTIGLLSSLYFNKAIFSSIKID